MSNRGDNHILQELSLLAALDIVNANVDTTTIPEIRNISKAVAGKFYGAEVEQLLSFANRPSELLTLGTRIVAAPQITYGGSGYGQVATSQLVPICLSANNEAAWTEFVRRFRPPIASVICKHAYKLGNFSLDLVEDLVQETFFKLLANDCRTLRNLKIEHEQTVTEFLKILAKSVASDHLRLAALKHGSGSAKVSKSPLDTKKIYDLVSSSFKSNILIEEIDRHLKARSQGLNYERDRMIFWLYYRNGLTAQEISRLPEVGLTVKGIESVLFRITQQIRQSLSSRASKKESKQKPK